MNRALALLVVLGVAAAGACTHNGEADPPRALPESDIKLPEYYGYYAIDRDQTHDFSGRHVDAGPSVEFLVFDKLVPTGLFADRWKLYRLEVDNPAQERKLEDWNTWDKHDVEVRSKPIAGKPEMIRIVPVQPLAPGIYVLTGSGVFFTVERQRYANQLADAARRAFDAKRWDEAKYAAQKALGIRVLGSPTSPAEGADIQRVHDEMKALLLKAQFSSAASAARTALEQHRWKDAETAARKALDFYFEDEEMTALIQSIPLRLRHL